MQNLLQFLARYYFLWLFLLLETLAVILMVQNQHHHRSFFLHSGNLISGSIYRQTDRLTAYFSLRRDHERLMQENALLMQQLQGSFGETGHEVMVYRDTIYQRRYAYMSARVINNSVNRRNNYITLDKGSQHGVEPNMGVITPRGVIGIVKNVSPLFSSVISLLHQDMQISVRLEKSGHIGSLIWEGGDYRRATMAYIPSHLELTPGDTVVTSGYSRIFPPHVFIGTIEDHELRRGDNFFTAGIALAEDFNRLIQVHVVKDLLGEEQDQLEAMEAY